jgi:hypothetical protein
MKSTFTPCLLALMTVLAGIYSGCLQVNTTEHRIKLNKDGSGEHMLRLIDIRSDGATDSAVVHDFNALMASYNEGAAKEFAGPGRTVIDRKLYTRGDTLVGEMTYTVKEPGAIEGLHVTEAELSISVAPSRVIVRTNGQVRRDDRGYQHVVWDRDASRLLYSIREKEMPPAVSLAAMFRGQKR